MIDPNSLKLKWWNFFIDLLVIYFIFITPILIVFEEYHKSFKGIEFAFDFIYICDVIRRFFTPEHGEK